MNELRNYMEILVDQAFDNATKDLDICKCPICRLDIMAIALNSLNPRYIVSDKSDLYVKLNILEQQFSTDILSAIIKGTIIVNDNKRHD